jgi:beta-lactamase regulating signal transducer with metallopeptidase domain
MNFPANLHSIAAMGAARILFSMGIGTLLAVVVWLLLRLFPRRDSRTSFVVWFATLLITAALPLLSLYSGSTAGAAGPQPPAIITISAAWAVYIFLAWAGVACVLLARVGLALWQVHRLRTGSKAVDAGTLNPELKALIEEFGRSRPLALLVSRRLEVPTAIGFFKPAVVLPEWFLRETPAEELKYVVLHELAHLRRRDDWTNLAQQVVKALLFFVPSVWWIERKLSLEREMACDDAVLDHSGTPRGYAECLAHVAERSFLRRQLALAQAAVSRVRQLTLRVTKILDPDRRPSGGLWKPAIPVVMAAAGLCAFSASQAPSLIGFADGSPTATPSSEVVAGGPAKRWPAKPVADSVVKSPAYNAKPLTATTARILPAKLSSAAAASSMAQPRARAWNAALRSSESAEKLRKDLARQRSARNEVAARSNVATRSKEALRPVLLAATQRPSLTETEPSRLDSAQPLQPQAAEYVTVREEFVIVVTRRTGAATQESWQMHVVQISVTPAKIAQKQVPSKI